MLTPDFSQIPASLYGRGDRWVLWRLEPDERGKPTKVPYQVKAPARKASPTDPRHWAPYVLACQAYDAAADHGRPCDGVGLVLGDGLVGVDLDDCRNPQTGDLTPLATEIVRHFNLTYREVSPSETGLKIYCAGTWPFGGARKRPDLGLEVYPDNHYFTTTGARLGHATRIADCSKGLAWLAKTYFPTPDPSPCTRSTEPVSASDQEILDRARTAENGLLFSDLYDVEDGWRTHYSSQSEADLALGTILAFYTGRDAARVDTLFRGSALMRLKWNRADYRTRTIAKAIARCDETYTDPIPEVEVTDSRSSTTSTTSSTASATTLDAPPYTFVTPFPKDHFVSQFITYAAQRTDAAHEYHELHALALLATVTPGVKAQIAQYIRGLGTNVYGLVLGDSSFSRKTASREIAADLIREVDAAALAPSWASPEGFIEELALRSPRGLLWHCDEFEGLVVRLETAKYMASFKEVLLTVFDGGDFTHRRHSKTKKGGGKVEDVDRVRRPHLSVVGSATPTLAQRLTTLDVANGLVPRFVIVWPETKPARRPLVATVTDVDDVRTHLVETLDCIRTWAEDGRDVVFADGALETLDDYLASVEAEAARLDDAGVRSMLARLGPVTLKVAILSAVGRPSTWAEDSVTVSSQDITVAITVARRWDQSARRFLSAISESHLERQVHRVLSYLAQRGGRADRSTVARFLHLSKKDLDQVRDTLLDRALIIAVREKRQAHGGLPAEVWTVAS